MADPMLPAGTNYCKCSGCSTYFKSVNAFDIHRTGQHPKRRCMAEGGMRDAGLEPDARGYWRRPRLDRVEDRIKAILPRLVDVCP